MLDNPVLQGIIVFFGIATTAFWYGFVAGHMATKKIQIIKQNSWIVLLIAAVAFLLIWLNILNVGAIITTGETIASTAMEAS